MKSLMLDCISGGCIISGFARGILCECVAYNVSLEESRRALRRPGRSLNGPGQWRF
jgi:hypothetical protein